MSDQRQTFEPKLISEPISQAPEYAAMPISQDNEPLLPQHMALGLPVSHVKAMWIGPIKAVNEKGDDVEVAGLMALDPELRPYCIAIVNAPCFARFIPLN